MMAWVRGVLLEGKKMPLPLLAIPLIQAGTQGLTSFFAFNSANNQEKLDDTALLERFNDSITPLHARLAFTLKGVVRLTVAFPKDGSVSAEQLSTPVSPAEAKALIPVVINANQVTLAGYVRPESKDNFTHVTLVPIVLDMLRKVAAQAPVAAPLTLLGPPVTATAPKETAVVTQASLFDSLVPTELVSDIVGGTLSPAVFAGLLLLVGAIVLLAVRGFAR